MDAPRARTPDEIRAESQSRRHAADAGLRGAHSPNIGIDPVTGRERRTGEDIRPPRNIEDARLPGGATWTGRTLSRADAKLTKFSSWVRNLPDRIDGTDAHGKAEQLRVRLEGFRTAKDNLHDRIDKWKNFREDLKDSWWGKYAVGRWINDKVTSVTNVFENLASRRLRINERKTKELVAGLKIASDDAAFYDGRIMRRVNATNKRLDAKMAPIESFRDQIEARANELASSTAAHERAIAKADEKIAQLKLERRTGSQTDEASTRREQKIEALMAARRDADRALKKGKTALEKCYKHQVRLAKGHHILSGTKEALIGRYERRATSISNPKNTSTESLATTPTVEGSVADHMIDADTDFRTEGEAKILKNTDFGKLFKDTFPGAKLSSYSKLYEMYDNLPETERATVGMPTERGADAETTVGNWIKLLTALNAHSPEFRSMMSKEPAATDFQSAMNRLRLTAWSQVEEV